MTLILSLLLLALCILLALVTFVQILYMESMRLRTRDLPALDYFKERLIPALKLKPEPGALAFALIKHFSLLLLAIGFYVLLADPQAPVRTVVEALISATGTMVIATYAVPQILYRRTAAHWLLPMVPVFRLLELLVRPVVALLLFLESLVNLTEEPTAVADQPTSAENIEALMDAGAEEGLIEEEDRKLIQSVVEFGDKVVREVMTPRPNVVAISVDSSLEQLRQLVINEQYSRIPIYDGTIDNVVGFIHVRDMFELEENERATRSVRDLMRTIRFVPETKPVNDLMREMQADGAHMVIVVDEYGNTAGLATMEDLVEVILGEIRDEHEPDSDVIDDGNGGFIVSGNFDLARLHGMLDFRPEEDIESTTIGGLVQEWLGRVPTTGEVVERNGLRVEILASDELRVEQVRISKAPSPVTSETNERTA